MSATFNLRNCPFCQTELISSTVLCPGYKKYSCLECIKCHSYFFTKNVYKILYNLAEKENRNLSSNIHYYDPDISIWAKNTIHRTNNKKTTIKKSIVKPKKNKKSKNTKTVQEIKQSKHNKILARIKFGHANDCMYYKNTYCNLIKNECDPSSLSCDFKKGFPNNFVLEETNSKGEGVTALVISDNRRCTYNEHELQDVLLIVRVSSKNGDISDAQILASYCKTCDEYFILKSDYYKLKEQGVILCPIEDRTVKQKKTQKYTNAGSESRIHQLGYNVKKGSNFTSKQRQIILANIVENTGITKAEIKSNITRCINQHKKHKGYENAIVCWQNDLEFINNYHNGDIPKIKVDKLILKYKQDT